MKKTFSFISIIITFTCISATSFAHHDHGPVGACYIRATSYTPSGSVGVTYSQPLGGGQSGGGTFGGTVSVGAPTRHVRDFCFEHTKKHCKHKAEKIKGEVKMWQEGAKCPPMH